MFGRRQPQTPEPKRNTLSEQEQARFNELDEKGTEGGGLDSQETAEHRRLGRRAGLRFDR